MALNTTLDQKKVLVLNGPNLDLLGKREPEVYGRATLEDMVSSLRRMAEANAVALDDFQSSAEQALIERIHASADDGTDFIIANLGAFTHTSIALRDAFLGANVPFIEVHISNVYQRESYRHHSYLSDIAVGCIVGLGIEGYVLALQAIFTRLHR